MKKTTSIVAVLAAAIVNACDCGGPQAICGAGTQLDGNTCVAIGEGEGEGAEGEGAEGEGEGEGAEGEGEGAEGEGEGEGAEGEGAEGEGDALPAADDDRNGGTPVVIAIPSVGASVAVGGIVDPASAGVADEDVFVVDGAANARLRVTVTSFGAPAGAFVVEGTDANGTTNLAAYARFGLPNAADLTASRVVVLPLAAQYRITVADVATFEGGAPVGGDTFAYDLAIDALASVANRSIVAGAAPATGTLDAVDAFNVSGVAAGSFISASLAPVSFDVVPALWFVGADGRYVEVGPNDDNGLTALVPDDSAVLHVDFAVELDPAAPLDYRLAVAVQDVLDAPAANGGPLDVDTGGAASTLARLTLAANTVVRARVQVPATSTVGDDVFLLDAALNPIVACPVVASDPFLGDDVECRVVVDAARAGTAYVLVLDDIDEGSAPANNQVRLQVDDASINLASPVGVGVAGADVVRTASAPTDSDPDAWAGPWFVVAPSEIEALAATTDANVTVNVYDFASFALLGSDTAAFAADVEPDARLLVQAIRGDASGSFTLTLDGSAPAFLVEHEPNGTAATATDLDALDVATGTSEAADVDFWRTVTTQPGTLTVTVDNASAFAAFAAADVQLDIVAANGTTVLAGPALHTPSLGSGAATTGAVTLSVFLPSAGTFFARVTHAATLVGLGGAASAAGAYEVSFDLDADADAPGTCAAPAVGDVGLNIVDTRAGARGDASGGFLPGDESCFGFGHTVGRYAGPQSVYTMTVPAGATLVAEIVSASFDTALSITDGTCAPDACLVGADDDFAAGRLEHIEHANDSNAAEDVFVVVGGSTVGAAGAGAAGELELLLTLVNTVCAPGESRCGADDGSGSDVERCNADGSGFDVVDCGGVGCTFDSFNAVASCDSFCGPGALRPQRFCSDATTLQSCTADGSAYEETACVDACVGGDDEGQCTFGICLASDIGTSTCASEDRFGDAAPESFVVACNADASSLSRAACDVGAVCQGDTCANTGATQQQLCAASASTCVDGVETACDASGAGETTSFCQAGCSASGLSCAVPFGESCAAPGELAFPVDGASVVVHGNTVGAVDDVATTGAACSFGDDGAGDVVTSFVATESTSITVRQQGFDGVIALYEGVCGGEPALVCEDDFDPAAPTVDELQQDVIAGTTYFVVVAALTDGDAGAFTLTVTNDP